MRRSVPSSYPPATTTRPSTTTASMSSLASSTSSPAESSIRPSAPRRQGRHHLPQRLLAHPLSRASAPCFSGRHPRMSSVFGAAPHQGRHYRKGRHRAHPRGPRHPHTAARHRPCPRPSATTPPPRSTVTRQVAVQRSFEPTHELTSPPLDAGSAAIDAQALLENAFRNYYPCAYDAACDSSCASRHSRSHAAVDEARLRFPRETVGPQAVRNMLTPRRWPWRIGKLPV